MEQDQQFVEFVLKAIVDNPDDVTVERTIDEMGVLISVSVNPDDMGKVIGKSGQTAKAVRTLLKVVGAKNDARVNMKIIEPEGGKGAGAGAGAAAAAGSDDVLATEDGEAVTTEADEPIAVESGSDTDNVEDAAAAASPVDDAAAVGEAEQAQQDTEAAVEQPSDDDSKVDEATGEEQSDEPASQDDQNEDDRKRDPLTERSPLDDL